MSDLEKFIKKNKIDMSGYEEFKIGVLIQETRKKCGLTQEELAKRIHTKKSAISRIENHAENISLSTLYKIIKALGKNLEIKIS